MNPLNLSRAIDHAVERADRLNALVRIPATASTIEEDGLPLQLLSVAPEDLLIRKPINRGRATDHNPFLPYEEDLFVADLGPAHVAILNKFPVNAGHLLIITREFEEQTAPLNRGDFSALAQVMGELDGLVIFNGGAGAGASQRHKHLQLIPGQQAFIEPWLPLSAAPLEVVHQPRLLYRHAVARLDSRLATQPHGWRDHLLAAYHALLAQLGLSLQQGQLPPYNLLATRRWMMIIPRTAPLWMREDLKIPINAISFSGNLLIYNPRLEQFIREHGIRRILADVT